MRLRASHAAWVVAVPLIVVILGMFGWLAVIRRQSELRAMAVADPLTGLYNRRGFLLLAERQWQLALRAKVRSYSFISTLTNLRKSTTLSVIGRVTWRFKPSRMCFGSAFVERMSSAGWVAMNL